ncbi:MAG: lipoprotein insertase outer membrane protein LolB [Granulosicoccaceae bacterium]|jgi:outer membrane lipoprotein LolB
MSRIYRASLLALLMAIILPACTVLPEQPVPADREAARLAHRQALLTLETWMLNGRISIRHGEEAWHAGLYWHQIGDIYQIRIIAPLGQGGAQLDGSSHSVVLQTGDGVYRADSAERLLAEQFGWQLPVEGLRYWAIGRVAPGPVDSISHDEFGRLRELQQSGWTISYLRYQPDNSNLMLPGKVFLRRNGLEVRFVVDSWQTTRMQVARP